jgi:bifunctional DNA-binding transcriptional regulator/antitoxin component of YhaV-PrlF toxin-antitoxin module
MTTNYVMKVSSNGQVSIPAEARARWNVEQVVMVDLGPDEPVEELKGKYRRHRASSDRVRRQSRIEDAARERRR